eukprot:4524135-Pyramimonas_sp.AAC.1
MLRERPRDTQAVARLHTIGRLDSDSASEPSQLQSTHQRRQGRDIGVSVTKRSTSGPRDNLEQMRSPARHQ